MALDGWLNFNFTSSSQLSFSVAFHQLSKITLSVLYLRPVEQICRELSGVSIEILLPVPHEKSKLSVIGNIVE